jgi:hypothetical protein
MFIIERTEDHMHMIDPYPVHVHDDHYQLPLNKWSQQDHLEMELRMLPLFARPTYYHHDDATRLAHDFEYEITLIEHHYHHRYSMMLRLFIYDINNNARTNQFNATRSTIKYEVGMGKGKQ